MNIKSKLIILILTVSLVPLAISNSIVYFYERDNNIREIFNHLESLASIQRARINDLYKQNLERIGLVASRTQLRISLNKFNKDGLGKHQKKMNRIIADAKKSIQDFKVISIISLDGLIVASTDQIRIGNEYLNNEVFFSGQTRFRVDMFALDKQQNLLAQFSGPLQLDGKLLGVLVIESSVDNFMSSINDYTGLGETGETILANQDEYGNIMFLMPTRFDKQAALKLVVSAEQEFDPIVQFRKGEGIMRSDTVDYRGVPVLAVTRFIEDTNWAIVAKIDTKEAFARLSTMRHTLVTILIVFTTLVIFVSIFFSRKITLPINRLTKTAENIIAGKINVKADETSRDETGLLGRTFNVMMASQAKVKGNLEENINELKRNRLQLEEQHQRIQLLMDSTAEAIYGIDTFGKCTFANLSCLRLLGYDNVNQILGQDTHKLFHSTHQNGEHYAAEDCHIQRGLKDGTRKHVDDEVFWRADGSAFDAEYWSHPILNNEIIVGAVVTFLDITERKHAEQEKQDMLNKLEDKNEELERFTYTVSHDLKSPLVTIKGFLGLLMKDIAVNDQDRITSDTKRINEAVDKMQLLLEELLELSRIGRKTSPLTKVSLNELVKDVILMLESDITNTRTTITIEDNLPSIKVEEPRIKEVYLNLIENAIKYRREDIAPEIRIGVRQNKIDDQETVFYMHDNGIGIDPRYHNKIFDLFERLDSNSDGTGVGLAIVKRIIDVHHGQLWVESDGLGKGSTFCFMLPQDNAQQAGRI